MKSKFNLLILLAFIVALTSASYEPDISLVKSRSPSREIKYFDDSSTLLVLRDRKVSISQDDGKTFNEIDSIKEHAIFFEMDPYNNKRAFIMTDSKNNIILKIKVNHGLGLKLIFLLMIWLQFLKFHLMLKIVII